MRNLFLKPLAAVFVFILFAIPALAIDIQEVTSPGGIKAWLVEDKTIPLIAMQFSFGGGGALDPAGKEGVAHFLTGMMDEGAGDLDSAAFQTKRDELALQDVLRCQPRLFRRQFPDAVAQPRSILRPAKVGAHQRRASTPSRLSGCASSFCIGARDDREDPDKIASRAWMAAALGEPSLCPPDRTAREQTLAAVTASDLAAAHQRIFVRKTLQIAVVGDIDAATLARLLDETFGGLPEGTEPELSRHGGARSRTFAQGDRPQHSANDHHLRSWRHPAQRSGFHSGLCHEPPFWAAAASARASPRKSAKSAASPMAWAVGLVPLDRAGLFVGSLGTRNEKAGEALALVKDALKRMADGGADGPGTGRGQDLSHRFLCAALRQQREDRRPASGHPAGESWHRLYQQAQCLDRGGDP